MDEVGDQLVVRLCPFAARFEKKQRVNEELGVDGEVWIKQSSASERSIPKASENLTIDPRSAEREMRLSRRDGQGDPIPRGICRRRSLRSS